MNTAAARLPRLGAVMRYLLLVCVGLGVAAVFLLASVSTNTALFSEYYPILLGVNLVIAVLLAAMVLIAAGFTMRHARAGKTGQMVLLALAGGFLIFFLRSFAQILGENGQIPVVLAAWSPPIAAAFLALGLLLHLEDG